MWQPGWEGSLGENSTYIHMSESRHCPPETMTALLVGWCLVIKLCLTLLQPHGLQPTRLLCPWEFLQYKIKRFFFNQTLISRRSNGKAVFLLQHILIRQSSPFWFKDQVRLVDCLNLASLPFSVLRSSKEVSRNHGPISHSQFSADCFSNSVLHPTCLLL